MSGLALIAPKPLATKKTVNLLMSSTPPHLKITPTMVDDFIINPVLGAETIFKAKLDEFQKCRLKICWWVPRVMDSSGFSSAKTWNLWMVSNLRAMLFPGGHIGVVYYPKFDSGQKIYWPYYNQIAARSPIYRAQVGATRVLGMDGKSEEMGKGSLKGPSCWTMYYKGGGMIWLPAPGFLQGAKNEAGKRVNDLFVDEFTKIEATGSTGIDDQLIGRATRECFNKRHPLWKNHQLFLATAEDALHPAYDRYKSFLEEVERGNPDYAILSYSFKDYSDLPFKDGKTFKYVLREDSVLKDMKKNKSAAGYRQEALGLWSKTGKGWYSGEMIEKCFAIGRERGILPMVCAADDPVQDPIRKAGVHFFLGADPAKADGKKSDDGALAAIRAISRVDDPTPLALRDWQLDPVWAYKVRKADGPQWSAIIHRKHAHFQFSGICMDYNGGGQWIKPHLAEKKQMIRDRETIVRPIATTEDEALMITGQFILMMFRRGDYKIDRLWGDQIARGDDNLVDVAHSELHEAISIGCYGFPPKLKQIPRSQIETWSPERVAACNLIELITRQLKAVCVATNSDGSTAYSAHGARMFSAKGKKDFAYAFLYAHTAFLSWLRGLQNADMRPSEENAEMCL